MNKIKVLHISPSGTLYGTERHILSIVKYADPEKFEHVIVTPTYGNLNELLKEINVTYIVAGRKPGYKNNLSTIFELKDFWQLYKIIKQGNFDIIHSHLNFYSCLTAKFAGGKKLIHTRHGIFWSEEELRDIGFINRYIQKKKSSIADITIALSKIERNTLVKYFDYPSAKIRIIYNGVSVPDIYSRLNTELNKSALFKTGKFIVGTVGRFERQKGFDILIEIARKVIDKEDMIFIIIGSGNLEEKYRNMIRDLNLQNNVYLLGYQKNIFDYINSFDIFIQTSRWEGVPYVILEAMALKKPIVAISHPNVTGISEVVVNCESGLLIEDNFVDNTAEMILKLKNDRLLKNRLAENSFRRVGNLYTEENMSKDMHNIYQELISK